MTAIEPEVQTYWTMGDIVDFVSDGRHSFHLVPEATEYVTGDGKLVEPTITAVCSCGKSVSGLKDAAEVFSIIKEHTGQ